MKSPHFKAMIGGRMRDSDGFTYVYGAAKHCSQTNRSGNRPSVKAAIRADKRRVRTLETRDWKRENGIAC